MTRAVESSIIGFWLLYCPNAFYIGIASRGFIAGMPTDAQVVQGTEFEIRPAGAV